MISVPEKYGSTFYRSLLSAQGKSFYDRILAHFLQKRYESMISVTITDGAKAFEDAFEAFRAVKDDHPEFFWLGYECKMIKNIGAGFIKPQVLYKRNQIERFQLVLQRTVKELLRDTEYRDFRTGQKKVYERIARRLTYTDSNDASEHNLVGPVLMSKGVCEGCNALLMVCLRTLGIPCVKVYGRSLRDTAHCWCMVWLDGKPGHCDVTWDIPVDGIVRFHYFNVSDRKISKDHFCFRQSYLPVCS